MKLRAVSGLLLLAILVQGYCVGVGCPVCSFGQGHSHSYESSGSPDDPMHGMNHDDPDVAMTGAPDVALSTISVTTANCGASPTCNAILRNSGGEHLRLGALARFAATVASGGFNGTDLWGAVAESDTGPPLRSLSASPSFSILRI